MDWAVPNNDVQIVPPRKKGEKLATAVTGNDNAMKPDLSKRTKMKARNSGLPRSGGKGKATNKGAKAPKGVQVKTTKAVANKMLTPKPAAKALFATGKKQNKKVANVRKARKHTPSGMARTPSYKSVANSVKKTMGYA
jgi:hypothetical protein